MAKNSVAQWDPNASLNTDVGSINIAEGAPAANMNNAIREMMAQVATWYGFQEPLLTGGASNAYTLTPSPAHTALVSGQPFSLRLNHTNTGNVTLNISSLGAVSVQWYNENTLSQITPGAWQTGARVKVFYDGTRFIWDDPGTSAEHNTGTTASWRIDYRTRTLECWGKTPNIGNGTTVSFPKTFANPPSVCCTAIGGVNPNLRSPRITGITATQFAMYYQDSNNSQVTTEGYWQAIGEWDGSS